jgi:hypothetical protein
VGAEHPHFWEMSEPERPEWLRLSDEFESAIGRMIVTFAHLEGNLRSVICRLVGGDAKKVLALQSSLDFRKLLPALSAQVHFVTKDSETLARIKAWTEKTDKVASRRNRFVHDQLLFRAGQGLVRPARYRTTIRKGEFKRSFDSVELSDVIQLSQDVADLGTELVELHDYFVKTGVIFRTTFDGLMRTISSKAQSQ